MPRPFKGEINLDVRESTPDWGAFLADRAPQGAPNVLVVLYDDTGCAAWSPYGGRINMPTMQRLADNGLTYSQWHTTALCSPTRPTFLTGRNHHLNGYASISEAATGFPGYSRAGDPDHDRPLRPHRGGPVRRLRRRGCRQLRLHPKFEWTGGQIHKVVYDDAYIDVEAHLAAAIARD
jgi:Sulfatase